MTNKKSILSLLAILSLSIFSFSCDEENVYITEYVGANSRYVTIHQDDWGYNSQNKIHSTFISVPDITLDVLDRGLVLVYKTSAPGQDRMQLLPRTETYFKLDSGTVDYTIEWGYWIENGLVEIEYIHSKLYDLPPANTIEVKIVIVDDMQYAMSTDTDFGNYEEVIKKFDVKEVDLKGEVLHK